MNILFRCALEHLTTSLCVNMKGTSSVVLLFFLVPFYSVTAVTCSSEARLF